MLAALETASGRKPIVFGKPEPHLFNEALQMLGTPLSHTVVVGDRLETDILGGKNAGMPTALVLTGVATSEDAANSNYKPDYMFQDLTSLCEALG